MPTKRAVLSRMCTTYGATHACGARDCGAAQPSFPGRCVHVDAGREWQESVRIRTPPPAGMWVALLRSVSRAVTRSAAIRRSATVRGRPATVSRSRCRASRVTSGGWSRGVPSGSWSSGVSSGSCCWCVSSSGGSCSVSTAGRGRAVSSACSRRTVAGSGRRNRIARSGRRSGTWCRWSVRRRWRRRSGARTCSTGIRRGSDPSLGYSGQLPDSPTQARGMLADKRDRLDNSGCWRHLRAPAHPFLGLAGLNDTPQANPGLSHTAGARPPDQPGPRGALCRHRSIAQRIALKARPGGNQLTSICRPGPPSTT